MPLKEYRTVKCETFNSFVEKKSEFIGYISPVKNEDEAIDFINKIRKKHPDATHNCYAYILAGTEIARFSDDGEPGGTAGMPILEVIKREGLSGVCIVVTRYFGGILLGAGGLVRAYAKGAKIAIDKAGICTLQPFYEFTLKCDYSEHEKIRRDLDAYFVKCDDTQFSSDVLLSLACKIDRFEIFRNYAINASSGRAELEITGERFDSE